MRDESLSADRTGRRVPASRTTPDGIHWTMPEFLVPVGTGRSDFSVKKSRFIGEALKMESAEAARNRIRELREEHPRSRHIAWAYVLGRDGALVGLSDDGEPHGTAGRPILDPIVGAGLTDTLVTVVRYFGGVKLGTGGLSAAYGRCSREAVDGLPKAPLVDRRRIEVRMEYPLYDRILRSVENAGGRVVEENFGGDIRLAVEIPTAAVADFGRDVADASRGSIRLQPPEETGI